MSIILDALRRGRTRQPPHPGSNAAQTDAVLATLGYGRFSPTSPFNRVKRILGILVLTILFAIVLWGAIIWVMQPAPPMQVRAAAPRAAATARPPSATSAFRAGEPPSRPTAAGPGQSLPTGAPGPGTQPAAVAHPVAGAQPTPAQPTPGTLPTARPQPTPAP